VVNGLIIAVREQDAPRERRLSALLTKAMWVHDLVERRLSRLIGAEDNRRWREKRAARRAGTGSAKEEGANSNAVGDRRCKDEMAIKATEPSIASLRRTDGLSEVTGPSRSKNNSLSDDCKPCISELEEGRPTGKTASRPASAPVQDDSALEAMLSSVIDSLEKTEPGPATNKALVPP